MASFHIDSRLNKLPDPIRTYNFEMSFPQIGKVIPGYTEEDITIRCRSASIPSRGNELIETFFMGMKQLFPGKPTFDNNLNIVFEEFEDLKVTDFLNKWQRKIFDTNVGDNTAGSSQSLGKRDLASSYATVAYLKLYSVKQELLPDQIKFVNIWPSSKPALDLNYQSNDIIRYNVTFSFDYWEIYKP